jgi:hypothetical protein
MGEGGGGGQGKDFFWPMIYFCRQVGFFFTRNSLSQPAKLDSRDVSKFFVYISNFNWALLSAKEKKWPVKV